MISRCCTHASLLVVVIIFTLHFIKSIKSGNFCLPQSHYYEVSMWNLVKDPFDYWHPLTQDMRLACKLSMTWNLWNLFRNETFFREYLNLPCPPCQPPLPAMGKIPPICSFVEPSTHFIMNTNVNKSKYAILYINIFWKRDEKSVKICV